MERNRFLTEAMGECFWIGHDCPKCTNLDGTAKGSRRPFPINFSTWEGFGCLWEWCQKQTWITDFVMSRWCISKSQDKETYDFIRVNGCFPPEDINPDLFADVLYSFLKERT